MKERDLWRQMFSPTSSKVELTDLRHLLDTNEHCRAVLEQFLYAEWCEFHTKARIHGDDKIGKEYLAYANSLAELAGKIFGEERQTKVTKETLFKSV